MITKENWIHFETIPSTNEYLLNSNLPHGTIVTSNTQTAGRGRKSKKWYDIPGSTFIFSLLLYYNDLLKYTYLPLIVALSVIEAINEMLKELGMKEKPLFIKWPNDILLISENFIGKLAGILIESYYSQPIWKVIIGIGLNWKNVPIIEKKEIYKYPPIALFDQNFSQEPLFFLDYLINKFNEFSIEKPYDFFSYKSLIYKYHFLNNKIIRMGKEEYTVQQIDINGYLQLKDKKNHIITITDWNEEIEIL